MLVLLEILPHLMTVVCNIQLHCLLHLVDVAVVVVVVVTVVVVAMVVVLFCLFVFVVGYVEVLLLF